MKSYAWEALRTSVHAVDTTQQRLGSITLLSPGVKSEELRMGSIALLSPGVKSEELRMGSIAFLGPCSGYRSATPGKHYAPQSRRA
jgi:hypothetical protein